MIEKLEFLIDLRLYGMVAIAIIVVLLGVGALTLRLLAAIIERRQRRPKGRWV